MRVQQRTSGPAGETTSPMPSLATKCEMADHVTRVPHPDDPQLDFLTIVAEEAVREKRNLIVRENYWLCNLGTIFKGMNSRKDLNSVISSSSSSS